MNKNHPLQEFVIGKAHHTTLVQEKERSYALPKGKLNFSLSKRAKKLASRPSKRSAEKTNAPVKEVTSPSITSETPVSEETKPPKTSSSSTENLPENWEDLTQDVEDPSSKGKEELDSSSSEPTTPLLEKRSGESALVSSNIDNKFSTSSDEGVVVKKLIKIGADLQSVPTKSNKITKELNTSTTLDFNTASEKDIENFVRSYIMKQKLSPESIKKFYSTPIELSDKGSSIESENQSTDFSDNSSTLNLDSSVQELTSNDNSEQYNSNSPSEQTTLTSNNQSSSLNLNGSSSELISGTSQDTSNVNVDNSSQSENNTDSVNTQVSDLTQSSDELNKPFNSETSPTVSTSSTVSQNNDNRPKKLDKLPPYVYTGTLSTSSILSQTKKFIQSIKNNGSFALQHTLELEQAYVEYLVGLCEYYVSHKTHPELPFDVWNELSGNERKIFITKARARLSSPSFLQKFLKYRHRRGKETSETVKAKQVSNRVTSKKKDSKKKHDRSQVKHGNHHPQNSQQLPRSTSTPQSQEPKIQSKSFSEIMGDQAKEKKLEGTITSAPFTPEPPEPFDDTPVDFHYYIARDNFDNYGKTTMDYDQLPRSLVNLLNLHMPPKWHAFAKTNLIMKLQEEDHYIEYCKKLNCEELTDLHTSMIRYVYTVHIDRLTKGANETQLTRIITLGQEHEKKCFENKTEFKKYPWYWRLYDWGKRTFPKIKNSLSELKEKAIEELNEDQERFDNNGDLDFTEQVKETVTEIKNTSVSVHDRIKALLNRKIDEAKLEIKEGDDFYLKRYGESWDKNIKEKTVNFFKNKFPSWPYLASILPGHPIKSAVLEELFRPVAHEAIISIERHLGKDQEVLKFHETQAQYSLVERIKRHIKFNTRNVSPVNLIETYNDSVKDTQVLKIEESYVQSSFSNTLHKSNLPWAAHSNSGFIDRTSNYEELTHRIYPFMFPITCMQSPTNSGPNFDACIEVRILGAKYPKSKPGVWLASSRFFPRLHLDFESLSHNDWFNSRRTDQKRKMLKILELEEKAPNTIDKRTTMFCKTDELIPSYEKFVPRAISNVSPYYLTKIGYFIERFQEALKKQFDGFTPFTFNTRNGKMVVYVLFACGKLSKELDDVWNFWLENGFRGLMVMGDDSLFYDPLIGKWETDYSKFDASQKRGEALDVLPNYMEWLGFIDEAKIYREMYDQPLCVKQKHKKDKLIGYKPSLARMWAKREFSMRLTGEPATCLANSLVNIYVAINSWRSIPTFAEYGLSVKFRTGDHVTFLKGVFLQNISGSQTWIRLPSFLLKFGKSLTNPTLVFKRTKYDVACQKLLWAQWLGYGNLKSSNWFYAAIHQELFRLTLNKHDSYQKLNEWQISYNSPERIDDETFNAFMLERYGVTPEEMVDYIRLLRSITLIPCVYTHSIFQKLLKDYI